MHFSARDLIIRFINSKYGNKFARSYKPGRRPWTRAYFTNRQRLIEKTLGDPEMMALFRAKIPLPAGYGFSVDERCVEIPWALAMLNIGEERVLDAGSSLNTEFVLNYPHLTQKELHIITLVPEASAFWKRGISYIFRDLRNIPYRNDYFDKIYCISTLEHIGFDNQRFSGLSIHSEHNPDSYQQALSEFRRVLKSEGKLLLTVPYGRYQDFGTFQQFNRTRIRTIIDSFNPSCVSETYYLYTMTGWNLTDESSCSNAEYVNWIMVPSADRPSNFPIQSDLAVAARAVACLELIK